MDDSKKERGPEIGAGLRKGFEEVVEGSGIFFSCRQIGEGQEVFLTQSEHERARCFRSESTRSLFVFGRSWLRSTLARELNVGPLEVPLETNQFGKPRLTPSRNPGGLEFNLSKSGNWVAMVLSRRFWVGIDVEDLDREKGILEFADQFLSDREMSLVRDADRPERLALHYWTAKEACLKCTGTGLQSPPDRCEISWLESEPGRVCFEASGGGIRGFRLPGSGPFSLSIAGQSKSGESDAPAGGSPCDWAGKE